MPPRPNVSSMLLMEIPLMIPMLTRTSPVTTIFLTASLDRKINEISKPNDAKITADIHKISTDIQKYK
jgi:hypothetical protein